MACLLPHRWLFISVFAVIAPALVHAQADQRDDLDQPDDDADTLQLAPVTVRIGRIQQLQDEPSAPISVIDRETLDARQARSLGAVLDDIPGATTSGGPRRDGLTPTIRGLSGGRVVVRLDGARQNLQIDHRSQTFLDPALLQRVEVLRGPASTLFGSGAIGGVVDFRTLDPDTFLAGDRLGASVSSGFQSNADDRVGTATGALRSGRLGVLASISRYQADDYVDGNDDTIELSEADSTSGLFKTTLDTGDNGRVTVSYLDYLDDSDSVVTADRPSGERINRISRQRTASARYAFGAPGSAIWDLDATLYVTDLNLDERSLESSDQRENQLTTVGLDVFNASRLTLAGLDHLLTYGIELYRDDQVGLENGQPRAGFASSEQRTVGVFVQDKLPLTPRTTLTLGLRYDDIRQQADRDGLETTDYSEFSPQATISYRLFQPLGVYASYAEAFRVPALRELYVGGQHFPGNEYLPNPDLRPEAARNYELGLTWQQPDWLGTPGKLTGQLSVYQNNIADFIEQIVRFDSSTPGLSNTTRFENVADARLRGAEAELRLTHPRYSLVLLGSRLRGEDRGEGDPLGGIPADQVSLLGAVRLWGGRLDLGSRIVAAARQDRLPQTTDPDAAGPAAGYAIFGVFAQWAPRGAWQVDLRVDNLTDRAYRRATNLVNDPGINAQMQLRYRFQIANSRR